MSRLDDFDPNSNNGFGWATYAPRRGSQPFKVHSNRGNALSAMSQHGSAILYRWSDGRWDEVVRLDPERKADHCERCMVGVIGPSRWDPSLMINNGVMVLKRRGRKLVEPLRAETLCSKCERGY